MRQIPLPLPHDAAMGVDDFLVTASNREAVAWVDLYPNWPAHGLIIAGQAGQWQNAYPQFMAGEKRRKILTAQALSSPDFATTIVSHARVAVDNADALVAQPAKRRKSFPPL